VRFVALKAIGILLVSLLCPGLMAGQDATAKKCNCYYSSDCSKGNTCGGMGDCTASGKSDGTCSINANSGGGDVAPILSKKQRLILPQASKKESDIALYAAIDGYFQAFLKAIKQGGGVPDKKLIDAAQKTGLSKKGHDDVEYAVWVALDAVMGWDFMYPNKLQRATGYVGNIREVHGVKTAEGIVDAARRGLLEAIQFRNVSNVAGPLQDFWAQNPNFVPRHLGRCYPHGHEEITDSKTSIACQIDTLERLAGMLIDRSRPGNPTSDNAGHRENRGGLSQ